MCECYAPLPKIGWQLTERQGCGREAPQIVYCCDENSEPTDVQYPARLPNAVICRFCDYSLGLTGKSAGGGDPTPENHPITPGSRGLRSRSRICSEPRLLGFSTVRGNKQTFFDRLVLRPDCKKNLLLQV